MEIWNNVLTSEEAAEILGVTTQRVRQLGYEKLLIGEMRADRWFYTKESVEQALTRRSKPMGRPPRPGSKYKPRKKKPKEAIEI